MVSVEPINKSFCLAHVCEENYVKLLRLIPDLLHIQQHAVGTARHNMALQLHIIERNPFTLTIGLNHCFEEYLDGVLLPAMVVRVYQDAKSAEVLSDHARPAVAAAFKDPSQSVAIMNYKWRLNYFLSKWLDHCLGANYQFCSPIPA